MCKNAVLLMESALYYSCIYAMLLLMLTARRIGALPYAEWCLLFVGWALRRTQFNQHDNIYTGWKIISNQ